MKIWEWIKQWRMVYLKKLKQSNRERIREDLRYMREHQNWGLLFSRLADMQGIRQTRIETGIYTRVDITMHDEYRISSYDISRRRSLRNAAARVAMRMKGGYVASNNRD